jgi:hypothetical protein
LAPFFKPKQPLPANCCSQFNSFALQNMSDEDDDESMPLSSLGTTRCSRRRPLKSTTNVPMKGEDKKRPAAAAADSDSDDDLFLNAGLRNTATRRSSRLASSQCNKLEQAAAAQRRADQALLQSMLAAAQRSTSAWSQCRAILHDHDSSLERAQLLLESSTTTTTTSRSTTMPLLIRGLYDEVEHYSLIRAVTTKQSRPSLLRVEASNSSGSTLECTAAAKELPFTSILQALQVLRDDLQQEEAWLESQNRAVQAKCMRQTWFLPLRTWLQEQPAAVALRCLCQGVQQRLDDASTPPPPLALQQWCRTVCTMPALEWTALATRAALVLRMESLGSTAVPVQLLDESPRAWLQRLDRYLQQDTAAVLSPAVVAQLLQLGMDPSSSSSSVSLIRRLLTTALSRAKNVDDCWAPALAQCHDWTALVTMTTLVVAPQCARLVLFHQVVTRLNDSLPDSVDSDRQPKVGDAANHAADAVLTNLIELMRRVRSVPGPVNLAHCTTLAQLVLVALEICHDEEYDQAWPLQSLSQECELLSQHIKPLIWQDGAGSTQVVLSRVRQFLRVCDSHRLSFCGPAKREKQRTSLDDYFKSDATRLPDPISSPDMDE